MGHWTYNVISALIHRPSSLPAQHECQSLFLMTACEIRWLLLPKNINTTHGKSDVLTMEDGGSVSSRGASSSSNLANRFGPSSNFSISRSPNVVSIPSVVMECPSSGCRMCGFRYTTRRSHPNGSCKYICYWEKNCPIESSSTIGPYKMMLRNHDGATRCLLLVVFFSSLGILE